MSLTLKPVRPSLRYFISCTSGCCRVEISTASWLRVGASGLFSSCGKSSDSDQWHRFPDRECEIEPFRRNKSCESSNLPLRVALHLKPDHQGGLHAQRDWHLS